MQTSVKRIALLFFTHFKTLNSESSVNNCSKGYIHTLYRLLHTLFTTESLALQGGDEI